MLNGVGVDVVGRVRVERALQAWGDRLIRRVLTERERSRWQSLDATFMGAAIAVKEAVFKASSAEVGSIGWHGVELCTQLDECAQLSTSVVLLGQMLEASMGNADASYVTCSVRSRGRTGSLEAYAAWCTSSDLIGAVATVVQ